MWNQTLLTSNPYIVRMFYLLSWIAILKYLKGLIHTLWSLYVHVILTFLSVNGVKHLLYHDLVIQGYHIYK